MSLQMEYDGSMERDPDQDTTLLVRIQSLDAGYLLCGGGKADKLVFCVIKYIMQEMQSVLKYHQPILFFKVEHIVLVAVCVHSYSVHLYYSLTLTLSLIFKLMSPLQENTITSTVRGGPREAGSHKAVSPQQSKTPKSEPNTPGGELNTSSWVVDSSGFLSPNGPALKEVMEMVDGVRVLDGVILIPLSSEFHHVHLLL